MLNRYSLKDIVNGIQNPQLVQKEVSKFVYDGAIGINRKHYDRVHSPHKPVLQYDWDNLLILDGCRYDTFLQKSNMPGKLHKRISGASESEEFLNRNFSGKQNHDVVYITANPHWYKLENQTFHAVVDLLDRDWNHAKGTVLPEDVVKRTKEASTEFPNKRLVVHFMQPHFPFLGPTGESLEHKGLTIHLENQNYEKSPNIWTSARQGDVHLNSVRLAYGENLQIALNHVRKLLPHLVGRTVVTADHGNMIGERLKPIPIRGFGHPRNFYAPGLVKVPWNIIPGNGRKQISGERPIRLQHLNKDKVANRMKALGYKESK